MLGGSLGDGRCTKRNKIIKDVLLNFKSRTKKKLGNDFLFTNWSSAVSSELKLELSINTFLQVGREPTFNTVSEAAL